MAMIDPRWNLIIFYASLFLSFVVTIAIVQFNKFNPDGISTPASAVDACSIGADNTAANNPESDAAATADGCSSRPHPAAASQPSADTSLDHRSLPSASTSKHTSASPGSAAGENLLTKYYFCHKVSLPILQIYLLISRPSTSRPLILKQISVFLQVLENKVA